MQVNRETPWLSIALSSFTIFRMSDLLEGLNDAQRAAVTHTDGPLLIVAGAGTGKTTALTRRYCYLLQNRSPLTDRISPITTDNILAVTFTEKAAGEMEDRVLQMLRTGAYDFWISTFHGFCQRVLERHGLEIGLPNEFRVLSQTDAWLMLRRRIHELPLDHYRPLGHPVKFLRALASHLSRAKDEGVTPEQYLDFALNTQLDMDGEIADAERKRLHELADLYFAYRKMLREEGCMDFGDLILETLRLFRERPAVLEQYRKQFRFIMVDEFQDTNWAQYELLKLLAGTARNITVVGDDDQAVYKFRGASLANILQFRDDYPDAKTVFLTKNYRSRKEILEAAYGFIKKNDPHRLEVRLADAGLSKKPEAECGIGGCVNVMWKARVDEEADAVAQKIKTTKNQEHHGSWNDFAILVRSNDSAQPFVRALDARGVPFQFLALRGLYAKPAILDVVALLALADGSRESSFAWRALGLPCYPFSAQDTAAIAHASRRKGLTLWMAIKEASRGTADGVSVEASQSAARMVQHVEGLAELARRSLPLKVYLETLQRTGYLAAVMKQPERERWESLQHLNAFAAGLKRYESAARAPTLHDFLEEHALEIESGDEGGLDADPDAGPEMVKIMTVHAAKGLEFKHVFVASLVDQRFPTRLRGETIPLPDGLVRERLPEGDAHLEEERRLFYVAMTRAKETLTLTGATQYGGARVKKPSVFFEEAGFAVQESYRSREQENDEAETMARALQTQESSMEQTDDRAHYDLKRRFSFTQLAAFRKCPLQYKFAHVYRIPVIGSHNKSFGQSMHLCFQRIMETHLARGRAAQGNLFASSTDYHLPSTIGGFRVSQEEALKIFEEAWIDQWYESRERHDERKKDGRDAVRRFWQRCAARAPDTIALEQDFTLVLGQHSLKGKIDRVDKREDGSIAVIDYKTGKMKETLDAEDKEQLRLYQIALEEKGMRVGSLSYHYVMDDATVDVELLKEKARADFLEALSERMDQILRSDFSPKPEPFTCKFCDFRNICEWRKMI